MSTRVINQFVRGYVRGSRRRIMVLNVDLDVVQPIENRVQEHEGTTTSQVNERVPAVPIDVDAIDDDVVVSSSTRFTQARTYSRRNRVENVVLDDDGSYSHRNGSVEPATVLTLNSSVARGRSFSNGDTRSFKFYGLDHSRSAKRKRAEMERSESTKSEEPIFSCPICMGPLVEETSTTCGHIFCNKCIKAALGAQKKCPTCRCKLTANKIHRVYLPTN